MSKSIKLKNDNYLDSSSIVHNRNILKECIVCKKKYSGTVQAGQTMQIKLTAPIFGLISVRVSRSYTEGLKLFGCAGPNGWAFSSNAIVAHSYNFDANNIYISVGSGNVYMNIKNALSDPVSYNIRTMDLFTD